MSNIGMADAFAVQAGAAATLTGLVFAAVSIHLAKIIVFPACVADEAIRSRG